MGRKLRDGYTGHYDTFLKWCKSNNYENIIKATPEYFRWLNNESGLKASTIRVRRQAVKNRLYRIADDFTLEEYYKFDKYIKRIDREIDTKRPEVQSAGVSMSKVINDQEMAQVLSQAGSKRQELFIRFLARTGCRVSEMTGLKLRACSVQQGQVECTVLGKGRKQRVVIIEPKLFEEIQQAFNPTEHLFETATGRSYDPNYVSRQIKKVTLRAIGRGLSAHCLRHTFATRMIERTGKVNAVSEYLGHTKAGYTLDYYCHQKFECGELLGEDTYGT